jgi:hypothetical protein
MSKDKLVPEYPTSGISFGKFKANYPNLKILKE